MKKIFKNPLSLIFTGMIIYAAAYFLNSFTDKIDNRTYGIIVIISLVFVICGLFLNIFGRKPKK